MIKDRKITTYTDNIKDLSDTPSEDGISADDLKAIFDGRTDKEVKDSINLIIDDLLSAVDAMSGADNIGATPVKPGGGDTVQDIIEELATEIRSNDAGAVHIAGAETITGDKTFTGTTIVPTPSGDYEAVTKKYVDTADNLKADKASIYTQTNLQTSGQALVHWGNLTNVPDFGDKHWKTPVTDRASLPLSGNELGDNRMVLDDGDGKQAVYTCIATTGNVDAQWGKIGDVDWVSEEATRVVQENARQLAEGSASPRSGRIGNELNRIDNENARILAEGNAASGRVKAEADRVIAENSRVSAENIRASNEGDALSGRIKAEADRVIAENARVSAENARAVFEEYDGGKAYVIGNKVFYEGCSYVNIQDGTGKTPSSEPTYWQMIASQGAIPDHQWVNVTELQFEKPDGSWGIPANLLEYDGTQSGLSATDIPAAVDEISGIIDNHLADTMPHQLTDLRDNTKYRFGLQISATGEMQMIYEEVV